MEAAKTTRAPLSRERVLRAAVALADARGIEALTMRSLGQELGVEAMSLYNHVANKEAILDGVVEVVVGEVVDAVEDVTLGSGRVEGAHAPADPCGPRGAAAPPLGAEGARVADPAARGAMRYYDGLLGIMLGGDFSADLAHHAMHALGSRALGFTQELFEEDDDAPAETVAAMAEQMAPEYPNLAEMLKVVTHDADTTLGWCDDQFEFEFSLDLLLDGLERRRDAGI